MHEETFEGNAAARQATRGRAQSQKGTRMRSYLKVKVCTLAAESKSIKCQMRRWRKAARRARAKDRNPTFCEDNYFGLRAHRCGKEGVQKELRDSNLAYGFLRNRPYERMEPFAYTAPNWANIEKMVKKFGADGASPGTDARDVMQRFSAWRDAGALYGDQMRQARPVKIKSPHLPGTQRPAPPHVG